jgi:hypothetical protein
MPIMAFDDTPEEWEGDDDAIPDYQLTANSFLICLQFGIDWFTLHELFMNSPNALAFETACLEEIAKLRGRKHVAE